MDGRIAREDTIVASLQSQAQRQVSPTGRERVGDVFLIGLESGSKGQPPGSK